MYTPPARELEEAWWILQRLAHLVDGRKTYTHPGFLEEDLTKQLKAHRKLRKELKALTAKFPHFGDEP